MLHWTRKGEGDAELYETVQLFDCANHHHRSWQWYTDLAGAGRPPRKGRIALEVVLKAPRQNKTRPDRGVFFHSGCC